MAAMPLDVDEELKCCICLELFEDPRMLPCLHSFCLGCVQRSLNDDRSSLTCPVCRARHELNNEKIRLLPVDQYAELRVLPLKKRPQQEHDAFGECKVCEKKQSLLVAWCHDCNNMICQPCVLVHKNIACLRKHKVVESSPKTALNYKNRTMCESHAEVELKYFCNGCSELVCAECLLGGHRDHQYSVVKEACHNLEMKIENLVQLVPMKKKEFSAYLERLDQAESRVLECSEVMKSKVDEMFDDIVASVEAQRNEALQKASQGVKDIWSQKEMVEVGLAQIGSFTRFTDRTHKCTTDAGYVATAALGIRLMERVNDTHGDQDVLNKYTTIAIGSQCTTSKGPLRVPLDKVFTFGGRLSLKFLPSPEMGSIVACASTDIAIQVSLVVGDHELPMIYPTLQLESYQLVVEALYSTPCKRQDENLPTEVKLVHQSELPYWEITVALQRRVYFDSDRLIMKCKWTGSGIFSAIKEKSVSYSLCRSRQDKT